MDMRNPPYMPDTQTEAFQLFQGNHFGGHWTEVNWAETLGSLHYEIGEMLIPSLEFFAFWFIEVTYVKCFEQVGMATASCDINCTVIVGISE